MTNKIQTISLEKLLKLEGLKGKEYLSEREFFKGERIRELTSDVQIKYTASNSKTVYVGTEKLKFIDTVKEVSIDKDGFPHYRVTLGGTNYLEYGGIFLWNTDFGSSMNDKHGRISEEILRGIKKRKHEHHSIYLEFRIFLDSFLRKVPLIREAKSRKFHFEDTESLKHFSELELEIFEYLAIKKEGSFKDNDDPEKYQDSIKIKRYGELFAFSNWYRDRNISNGYKEKIGDDYKEMSQALINWERQVSGNLEVQGFKRVDRLSMKNGK